MNTRINTFIHKSEKLATYAMALSIVSMMLVSVIKSLVPETLHTILNAVTNLIGWGILVSIGSVLFIALCHMLSSISSRNNRVRDL